MVDAIPDHDTRARLGARATRAAIAAFDRAGRPSSGPYPVAVTATSSAEQIARWLQWNDPNGSHTADLAVADGGEPYTIAGAWAALADCFTAHDRSAE